MPDAGDVVKSTRAMKPERLEGLTKRQREVLTFIARESARLGVAPTIREIGKAMRINSTNGVNDHLRALEKRGMLWHQPGRARSLKVLVPIPGTLAHCVCTEALVLLDAGKVEEARELLAGSVGERYA